MADAANVPLELILRNFRLKPTPVLRDRSASHQTAFQRQPPSKDNRLPGCSLGKL